MAEVLQFAKTTAAAFQCSALAAHGSKLYEAEQGRLFQYGYGEGVHFLSAVKVNPVNELEARRLAPGIAKHLNLLQGPSLDFILGRLYAGIEGDVMATIQSDNKPIPLALTQEARSDAEFVRRNCQLVGVKPGATESEATARTRRAPGNTTPTGTIQGDVAKIIKAGLSLGRSRD